MCLVSEGGEAGKTHVNKNGYFSIKTWNTSYLMLIKCLKNINFSYLFLINKIKIALKDTSHSHSHWAHSPPVYSPAPGRYRCLSPAGTRTSLLRPPAPVQTLRADCPWWSEKYALSWVAAHEAFLKCMKEFDRSPWSNIALSLTQESLQIPSYWRQWHLWTRRQTATSSGRALLPARCLCGHPHACPLQFWSSLARTWRQRENQRISLISLKLFCDKQPVFLQLYYLSCLLGFFHSHTLTFRKDVFSLLSLLLLWLFTLLPAEISSTILLWCLHFFHSYFFV